MAIESINLSEVASIRRIYKFGDILVPDTNQIYYDTMLYFLSTIKIHNIIVSKSSIENDKNLDFNFRKLVNFMKDYPDMYTNEMKNSVEEVIDINIQDVSLLTAIKLTKENSLNKYSI